MFINITDSKQADNKGSSSGLVHYLEKENRIHNEELQHCFNGQEIKVEAYHVRSRIDGNIAKLGKDDAKFFLINISPSQKEIAFLKQQYGEDGAKEQLKGFAVKVMAPTPGTLSGMASKGARVWYGLQSWKITVTIAMLIQRSNMECTSVVSVNPGNRCMSRLL